MDHSWGCPRVWADVIIVGNDAFASGDYHGNNSSILSKKGQT
jgi:hypothetical protein